MILVLHIFGGTEANLSKSCCTQFHKYILKSSYTCVKSKQILNPKQKWFDWKCCRLCTTMKKCLRDFNRCHTAINRFRFYSSRSKNLNFCSQKKFEFYNNNIKKLESVKYSKEWWKLANSLKDRVYVPAHSGL